MNLAIVVMGATLTAFLALGSYTYILKSENRTLRANIEKLELVNASCNLRLDSIINDRISDAEIDSIPNSGLTTVPNGWMYPPVGGGTE